MADWRRRADRLTYDGESVREAVDLGDAGVAVTSHRLLAFMPEGDGATLRTADRPNVEGVTTGARAEAGLLKRGVRFGVVGAVLIVAGRAIDLGGLVEGVGLGGASRVGLGGMGDALGAMLGLLGRLDELMQVGGTLALVLGAVLLGAYWLTRDRTLVVEIAGGADVHLPRPTGAAGTTQRIERALADGPGGVDSGDADDTEGRAEDRGTRPERSGETSSVGSAGDPLEP